MDKNPNYYFIGIKGSGMSALALILHLSRLPMLGSDIDEYTFTQKPLEEAETTFIHSMPQILSQA